MKKIAVVAAVALAGVVTATAAGCATSTRNLASLSSNWYYDSSYKRIQPTFNEEAAERLSYKVTQAEKSANAYYSVEHADGTYTTEFYAKKITAAELEEITLEGWRQDYTKSLGKEGYMYLYYYSTELTIPSVTYTCGNESKTFNDQTVKKESYFLAVQDRLSPVYSFKTVQMATPANLQPSTLNATYSRVDMTYESFYTLAGDSVSTKIKGTYTELDRAGVEQVKTADDEFSLDGLDGYANSVFDAAYLDITVRAMRNISPSLSQIIGVYSPGIQMRNYIISGSDAALSTDEDEAAAEKAGLQKLLADKGLLPAESELKTAAVSVAYNGGSYSGVSQTYWFAMDDSNQTRTLMVKYREPLTYNLGSLDYVLQSIDNI